MSDSHVDAEARGEVRIHETALVDPETELGAGVVVGPYAVLGPGVDGGCGHGDRAARLHRARHAGR